MRAWALFLLAAALLVMPWALRWSDGNFAIGGEAPYYHARLGTTIGTAHGATDASIVGSRPYQFSPYQVLVAVFYRVFGDVALVLLPMLIAWCSVLVFWIVSRQFGLAPTDRFWALLAFVLSPSLIASGFLLTPHGFVVLLFLGGISLLRGKYWAIGAVLLVVAAACGLPFLFAVLGGVLLLVFIWPDKASRLNILAVVLLVMLFAGWYAPLPIEPSGLEGYVSDLGGLFGVGIFTVLLGLLGLFLLWEYKRRFFGAFAVVIASLVAGFFFPGVLAVVSLLLAMLVGLALSKLWERKWELSSIRDACMLVLFCGLLFSAVSHAVALGHAGPQPVFFEAMQRERGVVLTHPDYGFWVEFAGHIAVTDRLGVSPRVSDDVSTLWASTDVEQTLALLEKYHVRYVVITPQMTQGLVWDREDQGLDFLVKNSDMFKRVDPGLSVQVYELK